MELNEIQHPVAVYDCPHVTCKQAAFSPLSLTVIMTANIFIGFVPRCSCCDEISCCRVVSVSHARCSHPAQLSPSRLEFVQSKEGISSRIDIMVAWFVFMLGDEAESILSYLDHDCILHQLSTNICLRTSWKIMIHACNPLV